MPEITDHDLILEMRGDIKGLQADVKEIKDNQNKRLDDHEQRLRDVEEKKVNQKDFTDYRATNDQSISALQRLVYIGLGIVLALQFALMLYVTYHK